MRITSKGQVTIPKRIRDQAGLRPHTEVEFTCDAKGEVRLFRAAKPKKGKKLTRGQELVALMRGKGDVKLTTDEIMAMTRGED